MKLSRYFTLEELIASQTAECCGIDNTPPPAAMANLETLARKLDEVRTLLGRPVYISSGYRSPALNTAIGSKTSSAHLLGLAADIVVPAFGKTMDVFEAIRNSGIRYDQLIAEYPAGASGGWVHFGLGDRRRQQALVYNGKQYSEVV